ncbi:MAG: 3-phosphoshikimate 1-carboxyvinyltransferase [Actinobacteria bacterium]|nr:3-phosphoshikimate 1-carboxyvinyltransferase [Actinomycetota bacterium]MBU4449893.1 3-phosphoshikimate 1-carboxyvinyltransferase [Actinomycetota bacterium]
MEISGVNSIKGQIKIPGDKSISHRSAIISSLTSDRVVIKNYLFSEDCIRTIEVLKMLGVGIEKFESNLVVHGKGINKLKEPDDILYVGNSGTTIRLLSGILCATDFLSILSGDKSINNRPMDRVINPLREMGASVFGKDNNKKAPIVIFGNRSILKGKKFNINVSSAQVKSCLMLAGLFADGETEIIQPQISRDHTERMLEYFGADISYDGKNTKIKSTKTLKGKNIYIPGDISSAAYFIVASLILKGSKILIKDLGINSTRNYLLTALKNMGAKIEIKNERIINNEPVADLESSFSKLKAITVESKFIPNIIDEIPILCVAAAFADGKTIIKGIGELRFKESDRISSITTQFSKLGVDIGAKDDALIIRGSKDLKIGEGSMECSGDHRIAMALAILSLKTKGKVKILDSECISASFPSFKYELKKAVY